MYEVWEQANMHLKHVGRLGKTPKGNDPQLNFEGQEERIGVGMQKGKVVYLRDYW